MSFHFSPATVACPAWNTSFTIDPLLLLLARPLLREFSESAFLTQRTAAEATTIPVLSPKRFETLRCDVTLRTASRGLN